MTRLLKKTFNVISIVLILVLGSYLVLKFSGKLNIYKILTGSMETDIHPGDYIVINKTDDYKVGDVVTYEKNGYYITHRIVEIDDDKLVTKGDANNVVDEAITRNSVAGKLVFKGKILNFIMNYKVLIVLLILSLFCLVAYFDKGKEKKT